MAAPEKVADRARFYRECGGVVQASGSGFQQYFKL